MRRLQTEYLLKGVFLGLLLDVALRESEKTFDWYGPLRVGLCIGAGLLLALLVGAALKLREGYRIRGRLAPFVLFLLLENSGLVYLGILGGMLAGSLWIRGQDEDPLFVQLALAGILLGLLFNVLRDAKRSSRLYLSLAFGAALVGAAVYWFGLVEGTQEHRRIENPTTFGIFLLLGLPVFYLLTFVGHEEETEVEVAAMFASLMIGLVLIGKDFTVPAPVSIVIPVVLYFGYSLRIMPPLRVFKHVLRGMSHAAVERFVPALLSLRRALQLDPNHKTAREEYWKVHLALDFDKLEKDEQLQSLVDFQLCVDRAGSLLVEQSPSQARMSEAHRLLDLVQGLRPPMQPAVDYWRAVARVHEKRIDQAAELLTRLLDPTKYKQGDPHRRGVLLPAWQLSLLWHEELRRRVGATQLDLPGRRMEAIAAVERHLAETPEDAGVLPLKRMLYQDVTDEEFVAACVGGKPPAAFDYGYVQQLGAALIDDPTRWERGRSYLVMAALGLPALAPSLYVRIAQACEKAGRADDMKAAYEAAHNAGLAVGHKQLAEPERQAFFRTVKLLGEDAMNAGDLDRALDLFHLYGEYERSGLETLRTIAELFERKGDALASLRVVDRALVYDSKDKDLLERRDRCYYSTTPEVVRANLEAVKGELDLVYCTTRTKEILDNPASDLDLLDWAEHLIDLALVVQPSNRPTKVLKARIHWRRGEIEQAASVLESVRTPKPEKFAGADDEEAWFVSCQMLAELYLNNLGRAADALACLQDFRKSPKSGAKTYYRLGQAYEQLGDNAKAVKCYHQAAAYEGNPIRYEAEEALSRLGQ